MSDKKQQQKPDAVVPVNQQYAIAAVEDIDQMIEDLRSNVQGITSFDLDQVVVPAGGGTTWEVPTLEGDSASKELPV
jgi:hypothetical protein